GATSRYSYSSQGNLEESTDPLGATTRFEYDNLHQPTSITQADGARWQLRYERGAITAIIDPLGAQTLYLRNNENLISEIHPPTGNKIFVKHDPAWSVESYPDNHGLVRSCQF